mgnify:CR=1 FL=1
MPSRRAFLAAQGTLFAAATVPGGLMAALAANTPALPDLSDWESVRKLFRLDPAFLHFSWFFISSHAEPVPSRNATLLSVQPPRVRSYTLYFEANQAQLAAESRREVDQILSEAAIIPAAEVDVIGHTDTLGAADYNDVLGHTRAQFVANLMAARSFQRARISVQSRGERELLVPTLDETAEPRNRRVEIRLR